MSASEPEWSGLDRVPKRLRAKLEKLVKNDFGDAYSAACRPGSWEYQTEWGTDIRQALIMAGFEEEQDPAASWRVRWLKRSRRSRK